MKLYSAFKYSIHVTHFKMPSLTAGSVMSTWELTSARFSFTENFFREAGEIIKFSLILVHMYTVYIITVTTNIVNISNSGVYVGVSGSKLVCTHFYVKLAACSCSIQVTEQLHYSVIDCNDDPMGCERNELRGD